MSDTLFSLAEQRRAIALICARKGQEAALRAAIAAQYGAVLPETPQWVRGGGLDFLWNGPGQYLALSTEADAPLDSTVRQVAGDSASVTAQGHGRVIFTLSGVKVRDVLAKLLPLDLHPRAFKPDDTALTVMAHINVQVWQEETLPRFCIAVGRSYADSARGAILEAAREWSAG